MPENISLKQIIKAIVVDDELHARELMVNYIHEYCEEVEIIGVCRSANDAYEMIGEKRPDLVFLDIDMPHGSGFDLLRMFQTINFKVVFVTAFSDYAIDAFRFSAVDYLLKPIKVGELTEAVEKVKNTLKVPDSYAQLLDLLESYSSKKKTGQELCDLHLKWLCCCESLRYYHVEGRQLLYHSDIDRYSPDNQFP